MVFRDLEPCMKSPRETLKRGKGRQPKILLNGISTFRDQGKRGGAREGG